MIDYHHCDGDHDKAEEDEADDDPPRLQARFLLGWESHTPWSLHLSILHVLRLSQIAFGCKSSICRHLLQFVIWIVTIRQEILLGIHGDDLVFVEEFTHRKWILMLILDNFERRCNLVFLLIL